MEDKKVANKAAKRIIKENIFMTLSTCSLRSKPWASTVNYVTDSNYNFYFISSKNSLHIRNILENPNVAFAIYDSRARGDDIDGVQAEARAQIVIGSGLLPAIKLISKYQGKKPGTFREFLGLAKKRVIKVVPVNVYKYDRTCIPGEDTRQKVSLME